MSQEPASLLAGLAKTLIEAALEAELVEHLARCHPAHLPGRRRNSRNGTRAKTVRSAIGPITIDAPRDRWGTFQPMTVGKWQREVMGVDRVLLPLAAKGAPVDELVSLLSQVYPAHAPTATLVRIAELTRARLRDWHERPFDRSFPILHVHLSTMRTHAGRPAGFPVVSVIGSTAPDADGRRRRELLSLHAVRVDRGGEAWHAVAADLHERRLSGVRAVVGASATPLREALAKVCPGAEELTRTA
jgi:transposase-like protein